MTIQRIETPVVRPADADLNLLLMIRHFELTLLRLFESGAIAGTTHTCLGQEHVPVALRPLIDDADHVFSNHRGHGHYLARFGDPHSLLAEIMGREGAVCHGVGGSQHLRRDRFLSTGVQGQNVPVAAGAALALKRREPGRLALVHIGDGSWGEGAIYEALNILVVENNGIAQSTPTAEHLAGSIAGRAHAFGIDHLGVRGTDVTAIRKMLRQPMMRVRTHPRPLVIEFETVRLGPHSKGDDTRDAAVLGALKEEDWYARYERAYPEQFAAADRRQRDLAERCAREVTARPLVRHNEGENPR
jgi:TPP-dependent pyruvate/acetoin dehydrogenase alpha subunit